MKPPALRRWLEADARLSARLRVVEKPGWLRRLAAVLAHSGDSWFWLPALALGWLVLGAAAKTFVIQLVIGILATAAIVMGVKFTVRRQRPAGDWGAVYRRTDPNSFPSGHAARMAMMAMAGFALGFPWFGLALLLWTPLVALARVAMGVHYLSDVAAGMLIGVVVALALRAIV